MAKRREKTPIEPHEKIELDEYFKVNKYFIRKVIKNNYGFQYMDDLFNDCYLHIHDNWRRDQPIKTQVYWYLCNPHFDKNATHQYKPKFEVMKFEDEMETKIDIMSFNEEYEKEANTRDDVNLYKYKKILLLKRSKLDFIEKSIFDTIFAEGLVRPSDFGRKFGLSMKQSKHIMSNIMDKINLNGMTYDDLKYLHSYYEKIKKDIDGKKNKK